MEERLYRNVTAYWCRFLVEQEIEELDVKREDYDLFMCQYNYTLNKYSSEEIMEALCRYYKYIDVDFNELIAQK